MARTLAAAWCVGAARGRFAEHMRRDDLWHLLLHLTKQKTVDYIRHQTRLKRGGGDVRGESVFLDPANSSATGGLDQIVADEPGPEMLAVMEEQHRRLLEMLPNGILRQIAIGRLQGGSNEDIAAQMKLSVRSVERKLKLIRERWHQELDPGTSNSSAAE